MKTLDIAINDVVPYENNPRHNDNAVDAVARSIEEFGFQQPLVLDKDKVIIVGHTRFKAAQKLGLKTVPCVIADNLTEEQVKAYRLADNKVGELATWDHDALNIELGDIFEIDMSDFGFVPPVEIDWDDVREINEENYEKPESDKLRCPICGGIDEKIRFKKA
jgi:site-specific DNA-methyltransferase (adenine-specific)